MTYVLVGTIFLKRDKEEGSLKALLFLFFVDVLPVCIMLYRMGFDCNLMMPVSGVFLFYLIWAAGSERNKDYILAGILAGVILYTYVISHIVLPGFLIFIIPYLLYTKKMKPLQLIYFGIPLGILAFPLIMVQLINLLNLEEMRFGFLTFTKLFRYRSSDIGLNYFSWDSVKDCLRSIFLYDHIRFDSLPEFGTIYYISIPFALIGIVKCIYTAVKKLTQKKFCTDMIFCIWFVIILLCGCMMEASTYRMNGIYVSIFFFLVEGVRVSVSWLKKGIQYKVLMGILAIYVVLYGSFLHFYFSGLYEEKYKPLENFHYPLNEAIEYLEAAGLGEQVTYIGQLSQTYIYYLGATLVSPEEYNEEHELVRGDNASASVWLETFKNYKFILPERIDFFGNYIVSIDEYGERLREAGFELHELEHYNLYTFDLSSFDSVGDSFLVRWDLGVREDDTILIQSASQMIEDKECVVLVGWAGNAEDNCAWDYFCLTDEAGSYYIADAVEREDVVESTGQENLIQSGLLFIIPREELEGKEKLWMVGIDSENKKYMKEEIRLAEE